MIQLGNVILFPVAASPSRALIFQPEVKMGKYDRCVICDYTEAEGSSYANVLAGENGRVRLHPHTLEYYCSACEVEISNTIEEDEYDQKEKDKCLNTTNPAPVAKVLTHTRFTRTATGTATDNAEAASTDETEQ